MLALSSSSSLPASTPPSTHEPRQYRARAASIRSISSHIAVDPLYIHRLLPWGLLYNDLGPWFPDSLCVCRTFPPSEECPPWTLQLELHYQKFHPQVWGILGADDAIDSWFQGKATEEHAKQLREYGEVHKSVMAVIDEVVLRRQARWGALYGTLVLRVVLLPSLTSSVLAMQHSTQSGNYTSSRKSRPIRPGPSWTSSTLSRSATIRS